MNNVLLVEDEILISEWVEGALRDNGIEVFSTHSGGEALRWVEAEPRSFSVLVTDINLGPGANGFQVAARARALNPGIQVVYITGLPENIRAAEKEALVCLKPFDAEELAYQVKDILYGQGRPRES